MKKIFLLLIMVALGFSQTINFENSYETAIKKAKKENKPLMAVIVQTSCPWCKKFKEITLTDPKVIKKVNENFIPLMLNKDHDEMPDDIRARMVPTTYFLDSKGGELFSTIGYKRPAEFLEDMDEALGARE
ncbi:MAG: hypothetical protein QG567_373 [Campylobacterota bacterium]|nr:hypothetical protein [Campylobacterota bacterium]